MTRLRSQTKETTVLSATAFREIVSGRKSGPAAALLRRALRLAEFPYTWIVNARNRRFEDGRLAVERVDVPVVSVGNLTLGGTGKTPMVQWLARWFQDRGLKVSLISRGYKSAGDAPNDEARELEKLLPGVAHWQNPDRVAAARVAVREFGSEVIVLDDAFQHRRIARDLDVVLIDALEPFGYGHVFPRGTLREPLAGLARANLVVLTCADMVDETERLAHSRHRRAACSPRNGPNVFTLPACSYPPAAMKNRFQKSAAAASPRSVDWGTRPVSATHSTRAGVRWWRGANSPTILLIVGAISRNSKTGRPRRMSTCSFARTRI